LSSPGRPWGRKVAAFAGAVTGAIVTVPFGNLQIDFPGTANSACNSFDQSLLFTICHPYPPWIPVAGAVIGAVLGWFVVVAAQRLAGRALR